MAETLLLVDDNPVNVALMERILRHQDFRILRAHSAQEALQELGRHAPDVILLDVKMPDMDGFELTRRLKSDPATGQIPILLVTGFSAPEDRERAQQAGADDIVGKPINAPELLTRVRLLLALHRAARELKSAEAGLCGLAQRIEARSPCKAGHGGRVARHAARLARRLGWGADDCRSLELAAVVHDLGHIAIPESVLLKPGKLTASERELVRQHPLIGAELCAPVAGFAAALPMIRHHHEHWDGSGYPDGLAGDAIPPGARLLALADAFDTLTTARPGRAALAPAAALAQLRAEAGRGCWPLDLFQLLSDDIQNGNAVL